MKTFEAYAPTGMPITGTLERIEGSALINEFNFGPDTYQPDGLNLEYAGETKMFWDGQITLEAKCGCTLYLDDDGQEWPECQLLFRHPGHEDMPPLRIWEAKREAYEQEAEK